MRLVQDLERLAAQEESLFRAQLLQAVYAFEHGERDAEMQARIVDCWNALHRLRMERLLGCVATPLPKPAD